jgi:amino acid permease
MPIHDGTSIHLVVTNDNPTAAKEKAVEIDHGADTQLHRSLGTRHLTMIALGSAIGMGMWLGSGQALIRGGPAALFIGYLISSSMILAVSQSIGEMAVIYPLPSAFVQWSTMFVSPAVGFALGWSYWFSYWITIANELQVCLSRTQTMSRLVKRVLTSAREWSLCCTIGLIKCQPPPGSLCSGWSSS